MIRPFILVIALALFWAPARAAPATGDYRAIDFDYFVNGDPMAPRAAHTRFGLALMGGGGAVDQAFKFIADHAGRGHILVLGAVGDDSFDATDGHYGAAFTHQWGHAVSAETIIFHNRRAAYDPRVIAALRRADGVFIRGGDQAQYIRYWKGTPVERALNSLVRAGRPIGGSSAGLAILGRYSYTALDGGSLESKVALADPFNAGVTLEDDFLHLRWLDHVVTDTHFSQRARLGRLIVFAARLNAAHPGAGIVGVGVDEKTALLIDDRGVGRIAGGSTGSVWIVKPGHAGSGLAQGHALSLGAISLTRLDPDGVIDMHGITVRGPTKRATISLLDGRPTKDSIATPILTRKGPLADEN